MKQVHEYKICRWWQIFVTFLQIGALTFGGGYAMIPLMERTIVQKHCWLKEEEMLDVIALAQTVPGVIAFNTAVSLGYRLLGFRGAVAGILGVTLPSLVVILALAMFLNNFNQCMLVQKVLGGVRAGVTALIAVAAWKVGRKSLKSYRHWLLAGTAFMILIFTHISAFWIILTGAAAGILWHLTLAGNGEDMPE